MCVCPRVLERTADARRRPRQARTNRSQAHSRQHTNTQSPTQQHTQRFELFRGAPRQARSSQQHPVAAVVVVVLAHTTHTQMHETPRAKRSRHHTTHERRRRRRRRARIRFRCSHTHTHNDVYKHSPCSRAQYIFVCCALWAPRCRRRRRCRCCLYKASKRA